MTATDLYNNLVQHGFSLLAQGDDLILSPSSLLSQEQRLEVRTHKSELLALLAANDIYLKTEDKPLNKDTLKTEYTPVGGGNAVILANSKNLVKQPEPQNEGAANDHLSKVSTSGENLAHPQNEDGLLNRYTDFITCQQCEYLAFTGKCTKLKKRVMVEAMRECELFKPIEAERAAITDKPFTQEENEAFLTKLEKEFFSHLAACQLCYVEQARYCDKGKQTGIIYDDMLQCLADSQERRADYQLRIDRACIGGRSVFEDYHRPDAPPPVKMRKYGMTDEDNDFLAHITRCPSCRPKGRLYCTEAKRLQGLIPFDE